MLERQIRVQCGNKTHILNVRGKINALFHSDKELLDKWVWSFANQTQSAGDDLTVVSRNNVMWLSVMVGKVNKGHVFLFDTDTSAIYSSKVNDNTVSVDVSFVFTFSSSELKAPKVLKDYDVVDSYLIESDVNGNYPGLSDSVDRLLFNTVAQHTSIGMSTNDPFNGKSVMERSSHEFMNILWTYLASWNRLDTYYDVLRQLPMYIESDTFLNSVKMIIEQTDNSRYEK